jgi:opacity protein-like surface antigen
MFCRQIAVTCRWERSLRLRRSRGTREDVAHRGSASRSPARKENSDVRQVRSSRRHRNIRLRRKRICAGVDGPGLVEATYIPAGAAYFTSQGASPSFGNYGFGTAVTVNFTRYIGVEGELGAMIATNSSLQFGDLNHDVKSPNMLSYTGNLVASLPTGHSVVPYATGGVGGLTVFERPALNITEDKTFLVGNVGGGVKWYAPNNRWGLRGDYRFLATQSKDDAPAFFGRETRYGHRVYGAVIINTVR